jgi:hypothetical protein
VATRKTHILRPRPPWRADITRCSRQPGGLALADPGETMTADARAMWKWRQVMAVSPGMVPPRIRGLVMPDGMCTACWHSLGGNRGQSWTGDPLGVLRLTPDSDVDAGRVAGELRALAALAMAHPAEFRRILESEQVLATLSAS